MENQTFAVTTVRGVNSCDRPASLVREPEQIILLLPSLVCWHKKFHLADQWPKVAIEIAILQRIPVKQQLVAA
eukprot:6483091-Amphidinium_carterae.1